MKNWKHCLAVAALVLCTFAAPPSFSREVSNPASSTPDAWSVFGGSCGGGSAVSGCEVAVDYTGNFLPTVTNVQTLGTSSLIFSNVYTNAVTNSGLSTSRGIRTTTLTASTTGLTVVAVSGQTADLVQASSYTATNATYRVTAKGQIIDKQLTKALIDAEIPDGVGARITCTNCTLPYVTCVATGTAVAQWAVNFSSANYKGSGLVLRPGCGTNE